MTLQSRTQPSVRAEDYGRGNAVTFQYAEWTDHERRLNRIREDMMIRFWSKGIPTWLSRSATRDYTRPAIANGRDMIVQALEGGRLSAGQIRKRTNLSEDAVYKHLNQMLADGVVVKNLSGRSVTGKLKPAVWALNMGPRSKPNDDIVLEALATPKSRYQLTKELALAENTIDNVLRRLRLSGAIVHHGDVVLPARNHATVKTWVKA